MDGPTRYAIYKDRFCLGSLASFMIKKTGWSDRKYGCNKFQVVSDDYKIRLWDRITKKDYVFDGIDMEAKGSMQKAKSLMLEDK